MSVQKKTLRSQKKTGAKGGKTKLSTRTIKGEKEINLMLKPIGGGPVKY